MPGQTSSTSIDHVKTARDRLYLIILVTLLAVFSGSCSANVQPQFDWKQVEQAIGKAGTVQPDGVYKIGLPRTDLHVKVGDLEVKPTLALGSWLAFRKMAAETMGMGDLGLSDD